MVVGGINYWKILHGIKTRKNGPIISQHVSYSGTYDTGYMVSFFRIRNTILSRTNKTKYETGVNNAEL